MTAFLKAKGVTAKRRAAKARAKAARYRVVCRAVDARDGSACRICGWGIWGNAHHHHIIMRSRGGTDTTDNLIRICAICHGDIHAHVLTVTGNADGHLQIERIA